MSSEWSYSGVTYQNGCDAVLAATIGMMFGCDSRDSRRTSRTNRRTSSLADLPLGKARIRLRAKTLPSDLRRQR